MLKQYINKNNNKKNEDNDKINFSESNKNKNEKYLLNFHKIKYRTLFLSLGILIFALKYNYLIENCTPINLKIKLNLISYDDLGNLYFNLNNTLSFNELEKLYYGMKYTINSSYNHIHILFAFDNDYYLLSSVTITSILKTANENSYIHFHIIASKGFQFQTMKKLNSLKVKINNNSDFIFYNGSRVEEDFGKKIIKEKFGTGEYAKLLASELLDKNIERVIILDSGDLLIQKDLLELYNYPLNDYLIMGVIDPYAFCVKYLSFFFRKYKYINAGVVIYNLKKWREMNLYQDIVKFYKSFNYKKLLTPHQDIINCFLPFESIGYLPLKYNFNEVIYINKNDTQIGAKIYT